MDTLTSVDPTTAATAIGTTIQILILNNWSFVVAALVAVAAIKLFKAGVQLVYHHRCWNCTLSSDKHGTNSAHQ